ncbi:hypothetical protein BGW36DRAFT_430073 [Talaromyces proteolyticus]|uniref:Heterokaryon incompatibility domain-containing protein n=1 Tax=Talaromyces proteolyticus TaxID=1131652 RepID=A0AAD4KQU5_9EURO|nr:uncharacterized protein BGW36DRAFT_430073 [Talaromyces proteolyticus]KAH8694049.1 hypothetical protein BGW36DRAFT_430073 [Talaromyces proteolyticus]
MYHWHESSCRRPDISLVDSIPYCNNCSSLPSLDETKEVEPLCIPSYGRDFLDLTWPATVTYSHGNDEGSPSTIGNQSSSETGRTSFKAQTGELDVPDIQSPSGFRLIRLKHGVTQSPIHIEYVNTYLEDVFIPPFEILSYTLEENNSQNPTVSSTQCYPIFFDSYWDAGYVARECECALRAARKEKADRLLWVYSLCINQNNIHEKNQQTGLINKVLAKASKIIAFVGETSPDSDIALNFFKDAGECQLVSREVMASLQSFFSRPLFSDLCAILEIILSRGIEILCGSRSFSWSKTLSSAVLSKIDGPQWLSKDRSWYGLTSEKDLLRLLIKASPYTCSDPRDKVLRVLNLLYENNVNADYRLSVESVYTGITAYVIKKCNAMDVLALVGTTDKQFDLPSWVPDWSQELALPFTKIQYHTREDDGTDDYETPFEDHRINSSTLVSFNDLVKTERDISIDADTGCMKIDAIKICDINPREIMRAKEIAYLIQDMGRQGIFIISIPNRDFEAEASDSLFLLSGWNHPVILRKATSQSYMFVCVCSLSYNRPTGPERWLVRWYHRDLYSEIRISQLSVTQSTHISTLYSTLADTIQTAMNTASLPREDNAALSFSTKRERIFGFLLFSQTPLRPLESRIRNTWRQQNEDLRWMFLDQAAVLEFIRCIEQETTAEPEPDGGNSNIDTPTIRRQRYEHAMVDQHYGVKFELPKRCDLRQFCLSFLQETHSDLLAATAPSNDEGNMMVDDSYIPSPILPQLHEKREEIQSWAETTEQFLYILEYTQEVFASVWPTFPGAQLRQRWVDQGLVWNWTEFEDVLRVREQLWSHTIPDELDVTTNSNLAAHVGLNVLGVNLCDQESIQID